jgi:hypothetical protein
MVPAGHLFLKSSEAFLSMAKTIHVTSRALVVMDRLEEELLAGNFSSVLPPSALLSPTVEFQKIIDVTNGMPVFGNPTKIDLVMVETSGGSAVPDGVDNDGNGLVDEHGVRMWEDFPPLGPQPGPEDVATIVCGNVVPNGLSFTRKGGVLLIDLTVQEARPGEAPATLKLQSGVKMRNSN